MRSCKICSYLLKIEIQLNIVFRIYFIYYSIDVADFTLQDEYFLLMLISYLMYLITKKKKLVSLIRYFYQKMCYDIFIILLLHMISLCFNLQVVNI